MYEVNHKLNMFQSENSYTRREGEYKVTRSICWSPPGCHGGCGVLVYTQNGKLVKVEGDPANRFNSGKLCVRGTKIAETVYHPDRLKHPLLRIGARGENKWKKIAFDEAINRISEKFLEIKKNFGAESVIFAKGTARDIGGWLPRLCYGFGSPNYFGFGPGNGNACFRPRVSVSQAVIGGLPFPDLGQFSGGEFKGVIPETIVVWGANPVVSNPDGFHGIWLTECLKKGSRLIVVDPRKTVLAEKADVWLRLSPGSDGALALGMLKVIFDSELHDKDFCADWVVGLTKLREAVKDYTPDRTAGLTGLSPEDIAAAARAYAESKNAAIIWGVSVDMNPGCISTIQSILSLSAVTGNIESPGGMIVSGEPFGVSNRGDSIEKFPDVRKNPIGQKEYPFNSVGSPYAQPDILLKQLDTGDPYPIKAAWLQGTGIIPSSFASPEKVMRLFRKIDFIVMTDIFLNPGAVALADIILPAAMYPEKDSIFVQTSQLGAINKAVEPPDECRSDAEIILELGKRTAPEYFPFTNVREWIDFRLKPSGFNFEELREKGSIFPNVEYFRHTRGKLRKDGKPGFETPSGRVELYSSVMNESGLQPIPEYNDYLQEYRDEFGIEKFPFILSTGARKSAYFCSEQRNIASLRKIHPNPVVSIHPRDAETKSIKNGGTVRIYSPFGECFMQAELSDRFDSGIVHCDYGWWYPEEEAEEPGLFGAFRSNVNNLLPLGLQGPGGYGYPFRSFICNIEPVHVGNLF